MAPHVESRQFVVVGCGLLGLATSVELARRGHDTLALERADIGHEWSGSKGRSRVFRLAYDHPLYVRLAIESLPGWRDLEAESGESLLETTGLLSFGDGLPALQVAMSSGGALSDLLEAGEVRGRYPELRFDGPAVLDAEAGVLAADKVLSALRAVAGTLGAEVRTAVEVVGLEADDDLMRVHTVRGPSGEETVVEAEGVIVCAGPGTAELAASAGLRCDTYPTLEQVAYFAVPDGPLPCVTRRDERPAKSGGATPEDLVEVLGIYGLPAGAGLYKFGLHRVGPNAVVGSTPLDVDPELLVALTESAGQVIEGLDPAPRSVERCVYDNTGDGHFVIDRVGRTVFGAGTSGHGFKFGPAFGRLLADLATRRDPGIDLSLFSLSRPGVGRF